MSQALERLHFGAKRSAVVAALVLAVLLVTVTMARANGSGVPTGNPAGWCNPNGPLPADQVTWCATHPNWWADNHAVQGVPATNYPCTIYYNYCQGYNVQYPGCPYPYNNYQYGYQCSYPYAPSYVPTPVLPKYHQISQTFATVNLAPNTSASLQVSCPADTRVTGGGAMSTSGIDWHLVLTGSAPSSDGEDWQIVVTNIGTAATPVGTTTTVYAICSNGTEA